VYNSTSDLTSRARFLIWQEIVEIGPQFHEFLANFLLRMRRNGQNSTSGQIFNPKFETPWAVSYSTTNFGSAYYKIYVRFEQKTAFVLQNFRNWGLVGVRVTTF